MARMQLELDTDIRDNALLTIHYLGLARRTARHVAPDAVVFVDRALAAVSEWASFVDVVESEPYASQAKAQDPESSQ